MKKMWSLSIIVEFVTSTEKAFWQLMPSQKKKRTMSRTKKFLAIFIILAHNKDMTYPCWKKAKLTQMGMWWMLNGTGSRSSGVYCLKISFSNYGRWVTNIKKKSSCKMPLILSEYLSNFFCNYLFDFAIHNP